MISLDERRRRRWAIHDTLTGEIRAIMTATESAAARNLRDGESLKNADDAGPISGATHYVAADFAVRPDFAAGSPTGSIGVGGELELSLPDGAEVLVNGESAGQAEGGGAVIDFPAAGEYEIEIRLFPYRTARLSVVVE